MVMVTYCHSPVIFIVLIKAGLAAVAWLRLRGAAGDDDAGTQ